MKRIFGGALLILFLAACSSSGPATQVDGFVFRVDPGAQTLAVALVSSGNPVGQQSGDRTLKPDDELSVASSKPVFLPGNVLSLELVFKNVSSCTFTDVSFSRGAASQGVVSSSEPKVVGADLGGDGKLTPAENTRVLQFGVTHTGKPFTYVVETEALVTCGGGTSPQADLQVDLTARSGSSVTKGRPYEYYANVKNNGPAAAAGVSLVVTVPFPVAQVPDGCSPSGTTLTCNLGDIGVDKSKGVTVSGTADEVGERYSVTATASATTADPKASNNSATQSFKVVAPAQTCADPVKITDPTLEAIIRADNEVKKPTGDLTCADLSKLTGLEADVVFGDEDASEMIDSLGGLQFAVNLATLNLNGNNVSDLTPLSSLKKLTRLHLNSNQVSDLAPLIGLTGLTELLLYENRLNNLTPLKGLVNLKNLQLGNQLGDNKISDVEPLRGLTKLETLDLYFNSIKNIDALVANEGIGNADDFVDLSNNCLDAADISNARTLEARSSSNDVRFGRQGGEQCTP